MVYLLPLYTSICWIFTSFSPLESPVTKKAKSPINKQKTIIFAYCPLNVNSLIFGVSSIENRIYREEFTRKKSVKRPFCCTVSILQVYFTYLCYITCRALEYHFIENLKLLLKENQIMK